MQKRGYLLLCAVGVALSTLFTGSCSSAGPGVSRGDVSGGVVSGEDPFQPRSITETQLAAGGKCQVELIYDARGNLADVKPITSGCVVKIGNPTVNGQPLRNNTGRYGITFGNGTETCYGPPVPDPARCVESP
jgi:hypothetical protein